MRWPSGDQAGDPSHASLSVRRVAGTRSAVGSGLGVVVGSRVAGTGSAVGSGVGVAVGSGVGVAVGCGVGVGVGVVVGSRVAGTGSAVGSGVGVAVGLWRGRSGELRRGCGRRRRRRFQGGRRRLSGGFRRAFLRGSVGWAILIRGFRGRIPAAGRQSGQHGGKQCRNKDRSDWNHWLHIRIACVPAPYRYFVPTARNTGLIWAMELLTLLFEEGRITHSRRTRHGNPSRPRGTCHVAQLQWAIRMAV